MKHFKRRDNILKKVKSPEYQEQLRKEDEEVAQKEKDNWALVRQNIDANKQSD